MSNIYINLNSPVDSEIVDAISEPDDPNVDDLTTSSNPVVSFWPKVLAKIKKTTHEDVMRKPALPAARIKRIMKIDDTVKMISTETAVLFVKACEMFIEELTLRGWMHTKETNRNTLYRSDVAVAVSKYDQFDFLIDIVPREEITLKKKEASRLSIPDINYFFPVTPRKSEVKKLSPRQIAAKVDDDENNKNKVNSVETLRTEKKKRARKTGKSAKNSQMPSDVLPFELGTAEIFQQIILPTGEIQHIPLQALQLQPFLVPHAGNYQPFVFENATALTVQSSSRQMAVYEAIGDNLEKNEDYNLE